MASQFFSGSFVALLGAADNQGNPLLFYRRRQGNRPGKTLGQLDQVLDRLWIRQGQRRPLTGGFTKRQMFCNCPEPKE